ncbi:MAG: hypothetical protein HZB38_17650 [Planctomycetes bacterium]|nr:hypothetical protein [Planctomycetota bacterium]
MAAAFLLVIAGPLLFVHPSRPVAAQIGGGGGTQLRSPDAGLPNPWEAGLAVNPFTTVNLYNGNACSVFHLVSFNPVGPGISFSLIHNSAAAASGSGSIAPWGFSLGAGWRLSYSSSVVRDDANNKATLIEDDGNEYVFALSGGSYTPPAGRFDRMTLVTETTYTITATNQSVRTYSRIADTPSQYRLASVADSSGNVVNLDYESAELRYIRSAADGLPDGNGGTLNHELALAITNSRLTQVTDVIGRHWTMEYEPDAPNRLKRINYPDDGGATTPASYVEFSYDTSSRLSAIRDREGHTWELQYGAGRVALTKDPPASTGAPQNQQTISYPGFKMEGYWRTTVTDRRVKNWQFDFDDAANLRRSADPLGLAANPKYYRTYTYDSNHNVLTFTDERGKTWTATYYANSAQLDTLTGPPVGVPPAPQVWNLDWAQPDPTGKPEFWRLTQVTDPLGHWVQYAYNDAGDPTHVTTVTEMPDGVSGSPSNAPGSTGIGYYGASTPNARGRLKVVTDANLVSHQYDYDVWGYFASLKEGGVLDPSRSPDPTNGVIFNMDNNGCGYPVGTFSDLTCADVEWDPNGNMEAVSCCFALGPNTRLGLAALGGAIPNVGNLSGCLTNGNYDLFRRPKLLDGCISSDVGHNNSRDVSIQYDNLGRMTSATVTTTEATKSNGPSFARITTNDQFDADGRVLQRTGTDGQVTVYTYTEHGLPKTIDRSGMGVTYTYDQAGRLTREDFDNGAHTENEYDDANRLLRIKHFSTTAQLLHQTEYFWRANNTVNSRVETDNVASTVASVLFTHDNRDRLTREIRDVNSGGAGFQPVYDITYTYDQLGNRLTKVDAVSLRSTDYFYDTDPANREPDDPTRNNRLMRYEERVNSVLQRTVWYTYWKHGDASNITIKDAAEPTVRRDLSLFYSKSGQLWIGLWDQWSVSDPNSTSPAADYVAGSYQKLAAREFRHAGGRARYLVRDIEANDNDGDGTPWEPLPGGLWTDYAEDQPYEDFGVTFSEMNEPVFAEQTRYLDANGAQAQQSVATGASTYLHGDLIDSTVLATDAAGLSTATTAYSAFGDRVGGPGVPPGDPSALGTRYQYAGGWGYESDLLSLNGAAGTAPIRLQHVGARWYQPEIGRFVQRDPAGLRSGLNVYLYCSSVPTHRVDPLGLETIQLSGAFSGGIGVCKGGWGGLGGGPCIGLGPKGWSGGLVGTAEGGTNMTGVGLGVGISITITNASDVGATLGPATIPWGFTVGPFCVEWIRGTGYSGVSLGVGKSIGVGVYGGSSSSAGPTCGATGIEAARRR